MKKLILLLLLVPATCFGWGANAPDKQGVIRGSGGATSILKDSNSGAVSSNYKVGRYTTTLYVGGNFTTTSAYTLSSLKVSMVRVGTATGTLVAHIYATSAGAPTGSALATSGAVDRSSIGTSSGLIEFSGFSLALSNATEYCIILQSSAVNGDEDVRLEYEAGGSTYLHEMYTDADGTPPFSANNDQYILFETYGI